jgi:hypothetical protein
MPSGIIKGSPTSCCSVGQQKLVARNLCNVARDWAGSCVITIKRLRELAGKSRTTPVRLRPGRAYAKVDALLTTMIANKFTNQLPLTFACATGWFCDEGPGQRLPQTNFSIEEARASDQ